VNSTAQDEITSYVQGVRSALAGLPDATREELLEDLPEHLAEVRAEASGTLTERLGTPEAYAAELRGTAGFVGGFPDPPPSQWVPLDEVRDNVLRLLGTADVKVGPVIGYEKASDFLILLRPAWWVLRGYLAAMAIAYFLDDHSQSMGLLPRIGGSGLFALVLLAGSVIVSILLGRRTPGLSSWPRYALWSGTAVLVLFALAGFVSADSQTRTSGYSDAGSYGDNPYSNVHDVYVYDSQGRLIQGARLFDQDGTPIQLGPGGLGYCTDPDTGESTQSHSMGYPYCPQNAPFAAPSATVTPADTAPVTPATPGRSGRPVPSGSASAASGAVPSPSGTVASPSVSSRTGAPASPPTGATSGR
jgi:hypothetical protein